MKKLKNWKNVSLIMVAVFLLLALTTTSGLAKSIKLNYVSFVPLASKFHFQQFKKGFIDKVNEKAKGELEIVVRGGPETVKPYDLGMSVQRGTIDMANVPTSFFETLVPGADATKISDFTAAEERGTGAYEMILGMYKKAGFYYLGRGEASDPGFFFLFVNKPTEKKEDFKGLKYGGSTAFHGFYKNIGGSPSTVPLPEYHSALERGIVDGIVTSLSVGLQFGLHEVSKYIVTPGVYRSNVISIVNLKKWDSLPDKLKKLMTESMVEYEKSFGAFDRDFRTKGFQAAEKSGCRIIKLSDDMAKWYVELAEKSAWEDEEARFPGGTIPEIKSKLTK